MRLVMNTVLPERLSPVTASHTVASPASSPRLPVSRSDACANNGGSQLRFTGVIRLICSRGQPIPPACECGSPLARGRRHTEGSGSKPSLLQVAVAVDGGGDGSVKSTHARSARPRTRVLRSLRLLGDAGRARLDRLQRP